MAYAQDDKLYVAKVDMHLCKKCQETIAKDSLRLAVMVQSPMFDGKVAPGNTSPASDQEKVKKAIETGGATGGQWGGAKDEKTLNDFVEEYAKFNSSTCKECVRKKLKSLDTVDPEKPQLGLIDRWYHTACFAGLQSRVQRSPAQRLQHTQGKELKMRLPAIKSEGGRLTKQLCSTNDMKELFIANGQEVPCGESNVRRLIVSFFFALLPCRHTSDRDEAADHWQAETEQG
uniref:PARP-type domain-containing protein n=1 Tax=Oncorhynchus tshawytscha TaxID=74940 RepID=A0AAZ3RG60_ONCTS